MNSTSTLPSPAFFSPQVPNSAALVNRNKHLSHSSVRSADARSPGKSSFDNGYRNAEYLGGRAKSPVDSLAYGGSSVYGNGSLNGGMIRETNELGDDGGGKTDGKYVYDAAAEISSSRINAIDRIPSSPEMPIETSTSITSPSSSSHSPSESRSPISTSSSSRTITQPLPSVTSPFALSHSHPNILPFSHNPRSNSTSSPINPTESPLPSPTFPPPTTFAPEGYHSRHSTVTTTDTHGGEGEMIEGMRTGGDRTGVNSIEGGGGGRNGKDGVVGNNGGYASTEYLFSSTQIQSTTQPQAQQSQSRPSHSTDSAEGRLPTPSLPTGFEAVRDSADGHNNGYASLGSNSGFGSTMRRGGDGGGSGSRSRSGLEPGIFKEALVNGITTNNESGSGLSPKRTGPAKGIPLHTGNISGNAQSPYARPFSFPHPSDPPNSTNAYPPRTTPNTTKPVNKATDPSSSKPRRRKAEKLNSLPLSSTTFHLSGHLLSGGDTPLPFIGSVILVLGVAGVWLGTTGVWVWRDGFGGGGAGVGGKVAVVLFGYLVGVCFGGMMATALRDPGILPRNLDPNPAISFTSSNGTEVPLTRDISVRKGKVTVKYCETCKLYRAPRSSHCRLCGNCVEGIDHHCSYLHNCVGRRNYTSFMTFLISGTLGLIYTVVFSALHFSIICSREGISFRTALALNAGSAVSFALGVVLIWPVLFLTGYHLRLLFLNSTTIEQIRASASRSLLTTMKPPPNYFSYDSLWRNLSHALCRPQNPSWIDASGWDEPDERLPNQGIDGKDGGVDNLGLMYGMNETGYGCNGRDGYSGQTSGQGRAV